MKIMHIIDSDGLNGAEIMLLNLMEEQRRMGLEPVLLSLGDRAAEENSLEAEAKTRMFSVIPVRMKRGYSLPGALEIVRAAREAGAALLHSHGYKADILIGSLPRTIRKIPMVRTQHGCTSARKFSRIGMYEALDSVIMRGLDAVVEVNGRATDRKRRRGAKFVIENGIPELKFDPASAYSADPAVREFCRGGLIVGTLSRLSEEKGLVHLIAALSLICRRQPRVKALVFGAGPQKDLLQSLVNDAGLAGKVMLAGYRNAAYHYLPCFDVFVLPSLTEGLPIALLEAMQAAVPIVATRVGGIPSVLENGATGVLVGPKDPTALAEAILGVLADLRGARTMGRNARMVAVANYSSRRMAENYLRVYETVLKNWRN